MTGKSETARLAIPGFCSAAAARWPVLSTEDVRNGLDMENDRFRLDDGRTRPWWPTAENTQGDLRVEGWAATGLDTRSRMWH